jgi:hypothetical protein
MQAENHPSPGALLTHARNAPPSPTRGEGSCRLLLRRVEAEAPDQNGVAETRAQVVDRMFR